MPDHCPGAANLRIPTLPIEKCPRCRYKVEVFSHDLRVTCGTCSFVIGNDIASCVQWCRYAKECVGEEMVRKLAEKKEGRRDGYRRTIRFPTWMMNGKVMIPGSEDEVCHPIAIPGTARS